MEAAQRRRPSRRQKRGVWREGKAVGDLQWVELLRCSLKDVMYSTASTAAALITASRTYAREFFLSSCDESSHSDLCQMSPPVYFIVNL